MAENNNKKVVRIKPDETEPNCMTCFFMSMERLTTNDLTKVPLCKRFPAQPVAMATPQGMGIAWMWPSVGAGGWCHEYSDDGETYHMGPEQPPPKAV